MTVGRLPAVEGGIQPTLIDAKGDLIAGIANDSPARLAVGNNGETIVADSSTSTGLRYQGSMAAGRNAIINGGMDIWQRGTSIPTTGAAPSVYGADRWTVGYYTAGRTMSRQLTNDTTNLPSIQYCARIQRDSGNTSTVAVYLANSFETVNTIPYAGKTVTMSFYARKGANYSQASSSLIAFINTGTGTDQNVVTTGYTGSAIPVSASVVLTTTWQRFTLSGTIATTATEMAPVFQFDPVGTAGANDYFEVTGVQLEIGSVATTFSRAGGTIQGELAACQRYYEKTYSFETNPGTATTVGIFSGTGGPTTTSYLGAGARFKVEKRVAPTLSFWDGAGNSGKYSRSTVGTASQNNTDGGSSQIGTSGFFLFSNSGNNAHAYVEAHWTASAEL